MTIKNLIMSSLLALTLIGCANDGGGGAEIGGGTRAQFCKSGDTPIATANQCLQDDAACYQLTDNSWCTGERGLSCPTGSNALPAGTACPRGARCFDVSDSMRCVVAY